MDYLREYSLLDIADIENIKNSLTDSDFDYFMLHEEKVKELLNYFISRGITNLADLIIVKSNLFHDSVSKVKSTLDSYGSEMIELINEDPSYLDKIGF